MKPMMLSSTPFEFDEPDAAPRTLKNIADDIKRELGLDEELPLNGIPAAAVEQAGFEPMDGTLKNKLKFIANECGIHTGW